LRNFAHGICRSNAYRLPALSFLADGGYELARTAGIRNALQVPALRRTGEVGLAVAGCGSRAGRSKARRRADRARADWASAMTTIDRLLAQKQQVLDRLQDEDLGPNERAELETVLAKVNTALSLLEPDDTRSER
jgi:hypothetical protein